MTKKELEELIPVFLSQYESQRPTTKKERERTVRNFVSFLPEGEAEITLQTYEEWLNSQQIRKRTENVRIAKLCQFIRFCRFYGLVAPIPVNKIVQDDYVPHLYSEEEMNAIIETADNIASCSIAASNKEFCMPLLIRLLAFSGMRLGECLSIRIDQIDTEDLVIRLTETKNSRERIVPLHESFRRILIPYTKKLAKLYPDGKFLFPQDDGMRPITKNQTEYEFSKILRKTGIRGKTDKFERGACLHCFRHTFAVRSFREAVKRGVSVETSVPYLSFYLGHVRFTETEKYLKFSSDIMPENTERFAEFIGDLFGEGQENEGQ